MKKTIKLFVSAATMIFCLTANAHTQLSSRFDVQLFSANDIKVVLETTISQNIASINTQTVSADFTALIAQTQLESELNRRIKEARVQLPNKKFKLVLAD